MSTTTVSVRSTAVAHDEPFQDETRASQVPAYVWLFLASLAFNIFSGHTDLMHFPLPPDRIFLAGALLLLVLDPRTRWPGWKTVHSVMLATVLWTAWSAMTAHTLTTSLGLYALLDRIIVPFVMFVVGPPVFATAVRRDLLLKLLVFLGIYLGFTSIFQMLGPKQLVFPAYILDYINSPAEADDGRAVGPFLGSESNGMAQALALVASSLVVARSRRWSRWWWAGILAVPLTIAGVLLALTRSVWVGVIAIIVVTAVILPAVRKVVVPAVVVASALIAAALASLPDVYDLVTKRLTTSRSLYDRALTYDAALRALDEHPIFGIGWATFQDTGTRWVRQADTYPMTTVTIEVHNVFLSRAVETGWLGAVLWGLAVLLGPARVWLTFPRGNLEYVGWRIMAMAGMLVWFLPTLTSPNPYPLPNNLMWLVTGFALTMTPTTPGLLRDSMPQDTRATSALPSRT